MNGCLMVCSLFKKNQSYSTKRGLVIKSSMQLRPVYGSTSSIIQTYHDDLKWRGLALGGCLHHSEVNIQRKEQAGTPNCSLNLLISFEDQKNPKLTSNLHLPVKLYNCPRFLTKQLPHINIGYDGIQILLLSAIKQQFSSLTTKKQMTKFSSTNFQIIPSYIKLRIQGLKGKQCRSR